MSSKPSSPDFILSAVLAGVLFAVLFVVISVSLVFSLVAALAAFLVGAVVLRTKTEVQADRESNEKTLLQNGRTQRQAIAVLAKRIVKPAVTAKANAILATIDKILETLVDDPSKVHSALQFLDYYLSSTVKVLTVYVNLSEKDIHDAEIQGALTKAEGSLDTIVKGFEAQLAKLLTQDVTDLNTEIKVLEQNLVGDGLIDHLSK